MHVELWSYKIYSICSDNHDLGWFTKQKEVEESFYFHSLYPIYTGGCAYTLV